MLRDGLTPDYQGIAKNIDQYIHNDNFIMCRSADEIMKIISNCKLSISQSITLFEKLSNEHNKEAMLGIIKSATIDLNANEIEVTKLLDTFVRILDLPILNDLVTFYKPKGISLKTYMKELKSIVKIYQESSEALAKTRVFQGSTRREDLELKIRTKLNSFKQSLDYKYNGFYDGRIMVTNQTSQDLYDLESLIVQYMSSNQNELPDVSRLRMENLQSDNNYLKKKDETNSALLEKYAKNLEKYKKLYNDALKQSQAQDSIRMGTIQNLKNQLITLKNSNDQIPALRTENTRLKADVQKLTSEKQRLNEQYEDLSIQFRTVQQRENAQIESLKVELTNAKRYVQAYTNVSKENGSLKVEIKRLKTENERLNTEIEYLNDEIKRLNDDLGFLNQNRVVRENNLNETIRQKDVQIARLQQENRELNQMPRYKVDANKIISIWDKIEDASEVIEIPIISNDDKHILEKIQGRLMSAVTKRANNLNEDDMQELDQLYRMIQKFISKKSSPKAQKVYKFMDRMHNALNIIEAIPH